MALHAGAQFTEGNLVVFRIGDGTVPLKTDGTGNPAFLDEYTTAGTLVQTVAIPTTDNGANKAFVSRFAIGEGLLNRSADGRYLVFPGYNGTVGGSTNTPMLIGRVDFAKNINTTTTFMQSGTFTSVISDDGNKFWAIASDQVNYTTLGSTSATSITPGYGTAVRHINIHNGQLYTSTANSIAQIGTGKPTTAGQSFNNLPGSMNSNFYQYTMFDMNPSVAGPDVIYAADQNGTINKYSLVGGNWVSNGTVASPSFTVGLTGESNGSTATLYVVNNATNNASGGGRIQTITDASGYNATFTGTLTTLATAANNTSFRGIAPTPRQFVLPVRFTQARAINMGTYAELRWTIATGSLEATFEIQRSADGQNFQAIGQQKGKGEEHRFVDADRPVGKRFYRIKAQEAGSAAVYSPVFTMANGKRAMEITSLQVQRNRLLLQLSNVETGKYQIRLATLSGQTVHREVKQLAENSNTVEILLRNLPAGSYVLLLEGPGKLTRKIVIP